VSQWPDKDGPEAQVPPDLHKVPDAAPRLEAIRKGGPNKPYEVLGQRYEPMAEDRPLTEKGLASWYGRKFHGRPTSSGEVYNMYAMTAAHATMPIPSYARVRNPKNGREVIVRINDRGPFHPGRIIDLSYTAALKLDVLKGVTPVEVERITYEDIRSGAWLRGQPVPEPPVYAAATPSGAPELPTTAQMGPAGPLGQAAQTAQQMSTPPVAEPPPAAMQVAAAPGFWLQLGAFSRLEGAETLRTQMARELDWMSPLLAIFKDKALHRLQAGPFSTREDARAAAEKVRQAMALSPVVVQRR
jgi:rare lipoprotein A